MRLGRAWAFLAVPLLVTSVSGCELADQPVDTTPIIIAADLELSGPATSIGTAYRRALQLKVDQLNASGALNGRKIELRVLDNRSDASQSLKNISEFTDTVDTTAIITGVCSACLIGAARTINDRGIPTIALAPASAVSNPVDDRRYIFKLGPNADDSAAALTRELTRAKVTKVALLVTDDQYGDDGRTAMTRELAKADIQVVETQRIKNTDTDVNQPVRALVRANAEAIVVWAFADQAQLAATSAHQAGFTGRLFFDAAAAGDLFLPTSVVAATKNATMIFTQTMVIDDVIATTPSKAARKQWFRDYTARYGSYFGYASFAADAVQLIANAVNTTGSTSHEEIRDVVETSQLDGLSGPIRLTPDNHSGLMPQALTLLVSRNGRWRLAV